MVPSPENVDTPQANIMRDLLCVLCTSSGVMGKLGFGMASDSTTATWEEAWGCGMQLGTSSVSSIACHWRLSKRLRFRFETPSSHQEFNVPSWSQRPCEEGDHSIKCLTAKVARDMLPGKLLGKPLPLEHAQGVGNPC